MVHWDQQIDHILDFIDANNTSVVLLMTLDTSTSSFGWKLMNMLKDEVEQEVDLLVVDEGGNAPAGTTISCIKIIKPKCVLFAGDPMQLEAGIFDSKLHMEHNNQLKQKGYTISLMMYWLQYMLCLNLFDPLEDHFTYQMMIIYT